MPNLYQNYVSKQTRIEAIRFSPDEESLSALAQWLVSHNGRARWTISSTTFIEPNDEGNLIKRASQGLLVETVNGTVPVEPGDWIVYDHNQEFRIFNDEAFLLQFDLAEGGGR